MGYFEATPRLKTPDSNRLVPASPNLEMSRVSLQQQASRFMTGFPGATTYAVKANPHPQIIELFYRCGINSFDVASIQEMELVKNAAPEAGLHYHNPIRSSEEIATAYYDYGCRRYSVDHISQLENIMSTVPNSTDIEIAIRFRSDQKSDSIQAFESKFGANYADAANLLKHSFGVGFSCGLTFHPGSQTLTAKTYHDHCISAAKISKLAGVSLKFLNVGGGFPSTYSSVSCDPLEAFFSSIKQACDIGFHDALPRLECEPGRALVAGSGELVTTAKAVRQDSSELFLNDGLYGGLLEVFQFPEMRPHYKLEPISKNPSTIEANWTVYGPTCDPLDVLPYSLKLPVNINEGDRIIFQGLGAYSNATATQFNGYGSVQIEFV